MKAKMTDESPKEEILVNVTPREVRAALLENGILQEVYIERASRRGLISNIYKGKVSRVLPGMQAGGWGRVINNTTSFFTMLRVLPYGATKAALESASAVWAKELAGSGVTVNVVVPGGPTDTAFIAAESGINRDKMLRPEVMVPPVRWLASDQSGATTGRRFIAALWDPRLSAQDAAEKAGAAIGWPELAAATVVWPDD